MEKTVIILGAGASASAGAPVMRNFLDEAEIIYANERCEAARGAFVKVFDGLQQLRSTAFKASLDTINLESVFNAFETAELLGTLGTWRDADLGTNLTTALRQVIVQTLKESITGLPDALVNLASFAQKTTYDHSLKFITFNYDVLLDTALRKVSAFPGYGAGVRSGNGNGNIEVPVFKLHGSVNWFSKRGSDEIIATETVENVTSGANGNREYVLAGSPPREEVEETTPLIVPPSLRKADHHQRLRSVWRGAASALAEAQNIIVVGFSLPPTDEFFKYLFAVGSVGSARLRRFWIVDRFANDALENRFRSILGRESAERFRMFRMPADTLFHRITNFSPEAMDWSRFERTLAQNEEN